MSHHTTGQRFYGELHTKPQRERLLPNTLHGRGTVPPVLAVRSSPHGIDSPVSPSPSEKNKTCTILVTHPETQQHRSTCTHGGVCASGVRPGPSLRFLRGVSHGQILYCVSERETPWGLSKVSSARLCHIVCVFLPRRRGVLHTGPHGCMD